MVTEIKKSPGLVIFVNPDHIAGYFTGACKTRDAEDVFIEELSHWYKNSGIKGNRPQTIYMFSEIVKNFTDHAGGRGKVIVNSLGDDISFLASSKNPECINVGLVSALGYTTQKSQQSEGTPSTGVGMGMSIITDTGKELWGEKFKMSGLYGLTFWNYGGKILKTPADYIIMNEDRLGLSFYFLWCISREMREGIRSLFFIKLLGWLERAGCSHPMSYVRIPLEAWKNIFDHACHQGHMHFVFSKQTNNLFFVICDENILPVDIEWAKQHGNSTSAFFGAKDGGGNYGAGMNIIAKSAEGLIEHGLLCNWHVDPRQGITYSGEYIAAHFY